jgi:hypothetical protein
MVFAVTLGAGTIAPLAAFDGGYGASTWGWAGVGLAWAATVALVLRTPRLSLAEWAALASLAAFVGWILLSNVWTSSTTLTMPEGQRGILYLAALAVTLFAVSARCYRALLAGVWAAVAGIGVYALLTKLFPISLGTADLLSSGRLSDPLGYWNGLGIFAAIGVTLGFGLAISARGRALRALASASLVVLVSVLYFTFSRGAWIALAAGMLVVVLVDPRRLRALSALVVLAAAPTLAVWIASRSEALVRAGPPTNAAAEDGRRLALALLGLALAGALAALALDWIGRRARPARRQRLLAAALVSACVLGGAATVWVTYGSPVALARKAYDSFAAQSAPRSASLNKRLFTLSSPGRQEQWELALENFDAHPILGSGAGTYERYWLLHRSEPADLRDAHSLYLETVSELGVIGLALLMPVLVLPLVAALRARRRSLVPAATGAAVAFVVHAGLDWDWEMPAVSIAALFCMAALLMSARTRPASPWTRRAGRIAALVLVVAAGGFAFVGLVGNLAISASADAAAGGEWRRGEREARRAIRWAPWSAEGWQHLGESQLGLGQTAEARAAFRRAIRDDPGGWEHWYYLAIASNGRTRADALDEARRLNPLSADIRLLEDELDEERDVARKGE